jgi:energy-coupling factor transporter ATP-binding protein EcfA2
MNLPISKIRFGERDGLHEYQKQDLSDERVLDFAFVIPPRVNLEELHAGAKYLIVGPKGTGKTTLLWQLKRKDSKSKSKVILFKSHIRKEDRDQFDKMTDLIVVQDQNTFKVDSDYKTIWEWYILRNTFRLINLADVTEGKDLFNDIVMLLEANNGKFNTLYDRLNLDSVKGSVKLAVDLGALKSELAAEIHTRRTDATHINLLDLVRLIQSCLAEIKFSTGFRVKLYFDELEYFISDDSSGDRDRRMVRDLLFGIYNMNTHFSLAKFPAICFASVRSEILHAIGSTFQELQKIVDAFGVKLNWSTEADDDNPVLEIFKHKINQSEILEIGSYTSNVWDAYFPPKIDGKDIRKYLLDSGHHIPRGVLMRLKSAAEIAQQKESFSESDFLDSEESFGRTMLEEYIEELSASLDESARECLIALVRGKGFAFTREEMTVRINALANKDRRARFLRDKLGCDEVLKSLFRIGMIGNQFYISGLDVPRQVWAFRGNADPVLDQRFVVHSSVRKILNTI